MDEKRATKLTVTFDDGSTEVFDNFVASVADGLIPTGKDDNGEVLYMASDKFAVKGIIHISATPEVTAGLATTTMKLVDDLILNMPPEIMLEFLEALLSLYSKRTTLYHEARSVEQRRRQG